MKQKTITHSCVQETVPRRPPDGGFRSELSSGMIIDERYELIDSLGQGGMSEVFSAMHLTLREPRALKVLPQSCGDDELAVERFTREARTTVRLKHPNIVEVSDAGVDQAGHRFIVMELLRGETLANWMKRTPVADRGEAYIREVLTLLLAVCEGVTAIHTEGVLHRDLKPSNIFLHRDEEGHVCPKILDFGIARDLRLGEDKLTVAGQITGSIDYVSPEQMEEKEPDFRADVYSLGVVLYNALTGATPMGDTTRAMIVVRSVDHNYRIIPPSRHNGQVPRYLDRITAKALERNPDKRYATVKELAEAIAPLPVMHPVAQERVVPKRRPLVWAAVTAVLLAVTAGGGHLWLQRRHGPRAAVGAPLKTPPVIAADARSPVSKTPIAKPPSPEAPTPGAVSPLQSPVEQEPPRRTPTAPRQRHRAMKPPSSKRDAPDVEDLVNEGYAELGNTNYRTAAALFEQAVDQNPRAARAWFGLARVAFENREYTTALDKIDRAIRYRDQARWRIFRGEILLAKGDRDAAAEEWRRVLDRSPEDSRARKVANNHLRKIGASSGE